jgi:hypothetical protein
MDADTKLVPSWRVGPRDLATAYDFMHDLAERLTRRIQLTTDGFKVYVEAVESAFGVDIDYAMLQKIYGNDAESEKLYSPAKILSSTMEVILGQPRPQAHIDFVRGTPELDDADVYASVYSPHQRVLKEDREPCGDARHPLHALQLCQDPQVLKGYASDGGRGRESCLVDR